MKKKKLIQIGTIKKKKSIRIGIIVSTYWPEISQGLLRYCLETLKENGISEKQVDVFEVPGSLEIPLLAKKLAKKKKYNALIALGAILKGKTFHFEQVSIECIKGCQKVAYEFEIPVIFEVISAFKEKDAKERIKIRGIEAALTALKMIEILKTLENF